MLSRFYPPLCLRQAAQSVLKRPVRSLLILQAIVWGSAASIFPSALFEGTKEAALTRSGELATDRIIVASHKGPVCDDWGELAALKQQCPEIEAITGICLKRRNEMPVVGTDRANLAARRRVTAAGRNFSAGEIEKGLPVCLLEANAAEELFSESSPLGKKVSIDGEREVEVIGVLKMPSQKALSVDSLGFEKNHSLSFIARAVLSRLGVIPPELRWLRNGRSILVPWRLLEGSPQWVLLRADPEKIPRVRESLQQYFALKGKEPMIYSNIVLSALFRPELEGFLSLAREVFFVCLAMGVVVIANVCLMSISERKVEIAIRRCEGATLRQIVLQFVLETGVFCIFGALVGIPIGVLLAWARASLDPSALISWAFPWQDAALTVAFVFLGGLLAGVAPAFRAAKLDPVEVLSHA